MSLCPWKPSNLVRTAHAFATAACRLFSPSLLYSSSLLFCRTGSMLPVTIFDKHSLRVLLHFARNSPPSRPDVLVVIISMLSSAPMPVTNIRFQAAVPKVHGPCVVLIYFNTIKKCRLCRVAGLLLLHVHALYLRLMSLQTMRVKLQPPSGSDLPAFNPILPPAAITQVLLLANPQKVTHS